MIECAVGSCTEEKKSRQWCQRHYAKFYNYGDPEFVPVRTRGAYDRMALRGVDRMGECLLFRGSTNRYGYGTLKDITSRNVSGVVLAHRVSYEKWHGDIPEGAQIDHVCHNEALREGLCNGGNSCPHRRCINPAHLEAKTISQNIQARYGAMPLAPGPTCRIVGCGSNWKMSLGYCVKHYSRNARSGQPFTWKSGSHGGRVNIEIHELRKAIHAEVRACPPYGIPSDQG